MWRILDFLLHQEKETNILLKIFIEVLIDLCSYKNIRKYTFLFFALDVRKILNSLEMYSVEKVQKILDLTSSLHTS